MCEEHGFAGGEIGSDLVGVEFGSGLVGDQDHNNVCPLDGLGNGGNLKARLLCLGNRFGARGQTYLDLNAGVLEVERVGVPL